MRVSEALKIKVLLMNSSTAKASDLVIVVDNRHSLFSCICYVAAAAESATCQSCVRSADLNQCILAVNIPVITLA